MGKRKLIEAAIPLDAINAACKSDKDRKTGTIRNLHKWFAPMPLPAWRALLFATLVDDPEDDQERDRLLQVIERLVQPGGDLPHQSVVEEAQRLIAQSWPDGVPTVMDPFCGGGSTLIEAQRLGAKTVGSDLNPVPALISKTLTELLPALAGRPALHPANGRLPVNGGAHDGVIADTLHYARIIRDRVWAQMSSFYPTVGDATVLAWLWCRTVTCPNPACQVQSPLIDSTWVSKRRGHPKYIDVTYEDGSPTPRFQVLEGDDPPIVGTVTRNGAVCAACSAPIPFEHIRTEGRGRRLGLRAMAVLLQHGRLRDVASCDPHQEEVAFSVPEVDDPPTVPIDPNGHGIRVPPYGITTHADLYTKRQLATLDAFAQGVRDIASDIRADGGDDTQVAAISALLGLSVGKLAQNASSQALIRLRDSGTKVESGFTRNDLPMTWDFAESNPFGIAGATWEQIVITALRAVPYVAKGRGVVRTGDARKAAQSSNGTTLVATDPPYFDQIGYADLSDYFYVWLRRALRPVFPDVFSTVATPKADELIAMPARHGGSREAARQYFVDGFVETFTNLAGVQTSDAPMLIVYAFKEQGSTSAGDIAPGWEAILEAVLGAGLMIGGTWPIHGTGSTRMRSMGSNALASYVVLVCRPRPANAQRITRSDFSRLLRAELAGAIAEMQRANIAPVDLAQAVIGPGMRVYSRHASVVETDGSPFRVAEALALVNRTLGEILDEQEGDLDAESRWAVTWYDDHGFDTAAFGKADQLARAKGIAVDSLVEAGVVTSGAGKVALIDREALRDGWDPATDRRATAWEAVQYLVRSLAEGGELAAAHLYARLEGLADPARELAYRLFQVAEKRGRTEEAIAYNGLVTSWSEIARLAADSPSRSAASAPTEALF